MASRKVFGFATRIGVAAVLVGFASACSGDGPTPPGGARSVSLAPASDIRLYVIGATAQITATPRDESGNPVSAPVTWTSSNTAAATVASTGATTATVTARGIGTATIRAAVSSSVFAQLTVSVQQPQFNVNSNSACFNPDMRSFTIEHQSEHLIIAADVGNPAGGFTAADYQAFAATFESTVWPVLTENFGTPADIDGNGKVIAFFTRAVNELTPQGSQGVIGGFFFGRDLFPKTASATQEACPASNEAEMFYLLVPDPNGEVNGNVRTLDVVRRVTSGVIAHEFQHLINSSRRLFVNQAATWPETTYMEEGLSHIAEELTFYHASGDLRPKQNLGIVEMSNTQAHVDAFNFYMSSNTGRLIRYQQKPSENAPYDKDDDLETRGAIWSFLRYLADRGAGAPFAETQCASPVVLTGPGASCMVEGASAQQFSVPAGTTGGEFAIIAFAKDLPTVPGTVPVQAGSITTVASASSAIAFIGPPNPSLASGGALLSTIGGGSMDAGAAFSLDDSFHARLRRIERRELPGRVPGARAAYSLKRRAAAGSGARKYSAEWIRPLMAAAVVEPIWSQLVNANDTGIVNLRGRFGQDISGAAQDWAVANYIDDTGLGTPPLQYLHQSWNFRTLLPFFNDNVYPLKAHVLTSPVTQAMVDGGAAYYRFGLAPGVTSTVSFTVNGGAPPQGLKLVVLRTK
jgi:hypothetical protein